MVIEETSLAGAVEGVLLKPERRSDLGVVVLGGSSGRVDVARARLFAQQGALAIAQRWFGGDGQVPGICEVPIETFAPATDRLLAEGCRRIAYVGTSKSAEAALLAAVHDPRIDAVVACSPSSVVWANTGVGRDGQGWPLRSSWTLAGRPLPFVPYDVENAPPPGDGPVAYRAYHERSLERFAAAAEAAAIPIELAHGQVVLVAGADDALWPSDRFAAALAERLRKGHKAHRLVTHPRAGHRVLLPGETTPRSTINAHGGDDVSDSELGHMAWAAIGEVLAFQ